MARSGWLYSRSHLGAALLLSFFLGFLAPVKSLACSNECLPLCPFRPFLLFVCKQEPTHSSQLWALGINFPVFREEIPPSHGSSGNLVDSHTSPWSRSQEPSQGRHSDWLRFPIQQKGETQSLRWNSHVILRIVLGTLQIANIRSGFFRKPKLFRYLLKLY